MSSLNDQELVLVDIPVVKVVNDLELVLGDMPIVKIVKKGKV